MPDPVLIEDYDAEMKPQLAAQCGRDRACYTAAKTAFIDAATGG